MILFHAFKHHLHTISEWLAVNRHRWDEAIRLNILSLGGSQLDLYTGSLSADDIRKEAVHLLQASGLSEKTVFEAWVGDNGGFRTLTLSDGSEWTLRYLPQPGFVHIHPSRYALHTVRVKANALKTCVCFCLLENIHTAPTVDALNYYRVRYLDLPPLNRQEYHAGIEAVYRMLRQALYSEIEKGEHG